jgi:hypothetical protein
MSVRALLPWLGLLAGCTDGADGTDGKGSTEVNGAPSIEAVVISPAEPNAGSTLTCTWAGFDDPDGDADVSTVTWTVNGSEAGEGRTLVGAFARGDLVACTVTPSDGLDSGEPVTATQPIFNAVPTFAGAQISPSNPTVSTPLTCTLADWQDADGDADLSTPAWTLNEAPAGTQPTLSSGFVRGDIVGCTLLPTDGYATLPEEQVTVEIGNAPPVLTAVTLTPEEPVAGSTLTCTPTGQPDADGDNLTLSYAWTVDGAVVPAATSSTFAGPFYRGQLVSCVVQASDGIDTTLLSSPVVTVLNTPPGAPAVSLAPLEPEEDDDLTCQITAPASDPDGDSLSYTFAWTVDDAAYPDVFPAALGPTSTTHPDDTVPADDTVQGQLWRCAVTADDGTTTGPAGMAQAEILPPQRVLGPSAPGSNTASISSSFLIGQAINLVDEVYLDALGVWVSSGTGPVVIGLYTDAAGLPSNLVADTGPARPVVTGANELELDGGRLSLPEGRYWIMLSTTQPVGISAASGSTTTAYTGHPGGTTLPNSLSTLFTYSTSPFDLFLVVR